MIYDDEIERSMLRQELRSIIRNFDIPSMRRPINKVNLLWMMRNLGIKNKDHEDFAKAIKLTKEILNGL